MSQKMRKLVSLLIILLCLHLFEATKRYDNYQLLKIQVDSREKLDALLKEFEDDPLDIWSPDGTPAVGIPMDILFSPKQLSKFYIQPFSANFKIKVVHSNIQKLIDEEKYKLNAVLFEEMKKGNSTLEDYFKRYHTYEEMVGFF
jgi:hypothetical protein